MLREIGKVSSVCWSAAIFSLIKAPAIVLFIGFVLLSFNNSIADTFLSSARELTGNVPADKVQLCVYETDEKVSPPVYNKKPCIKTLADSNKWTESVDSTIRRVYWTTAILGFATWFLFGGIAVFLIQKIADIWEKRKK